LPSLTDLGLSDNQVGVAGVRALSDALQAGAPVLPKLKELDLSDNCIGNAGLAVLAEALSNNAPPREAPLLALTELDVSNNGFGQGAAALIAAMLTKGALLSCRNLSAYGFPAEAHDAAEVLQKACNSRNITLRCTYQEWYEDTGNQCQCIYCQPMDSLFPWRRV